MHLPLVALFLFPYFINKNRYTYIFHKSGLLIRKFYTMNVIKLAKELHFFTKLRHPIANNTFEFNYVN